MSRYLVNAAQSKVLLASICNFGTYIVVYDYVLKCIDFGTKSADSQPINKNLDSSHVPLWYIVYMYECLEVY